MRSKELEILDKEERTLQRAPRRIYNHLSNLEAYRSLAGEGGEIKAFWIHNQATWRSRSVNWSR